MRCWFLAPALAIGLLGCKKPASVELEFGAAPHDFSFTFSTTCNLASDEEGCRNMVAAGGRIEFTPNEGVEPGACRLGIQIIDRCDLPVLILLDAQLEQEVHTSAEGVVVDVDSADFSRAFDDDADSFSNYLEWAESTDARNATDVPAGEPDL